MLPSFIENGTDIRYYIEQIPPLYKFDQNTAPI